MRIRTAPLNRTPDCFQSVRFRSEYFTFTSRVARGCEGRVAFGLLHHGALVYKSTPRTRVVNSQDPASQKPASPFLLMAPDRLHPVRRVTALAAGSPSIYQLPFVSSRARLSPSFRFRETGRAPNSFNLLGLSAVVKGRFFKLSPLARQPVHPEDSPTSYQPRQPPSTPDTHPFRCRFGSGLARAHSIHTSAERVKGSARGGELPSGVPEAAGFRGGELRERSGSRGAQLRERPGSLSG
jgi:hypothetical protein